MKTDRRDASKLARSHRSGDLTAVWVPDENSKALRDVVHQREAAKQDQLRARHRLTKFLLRTGRHDLWSEGMDGTLYGVALSRWQFHTAGPEATLLDCLNEESSWENGSSGWNKRSWK